MRPGIHESDAERGSEVQEAARRRNEALKRLSRARRAIFGAVTASTLGLAVFIQTIAPAKGSTSRDAARTTATQKTSTSTRTSSPASDTAGSSSGVTSSVSPSQATSGGS